MRKIKMFRKQMIKKIPRNRGFVEFFSEIKTLETQISYRYAICIDPYNLLLIVFFIGITMSSSIPPGKLKIPFVPVYVRGVFT